MTISNEALTQCVYIAGIALVVWLIVCIAAITGVIISTILKRNKKDGTHSILQELAEELEKEGSDSTDIPIIYHDAVEEINEAWEGEYDRRPE